MQQFFVTADQVSGDLIFVTGADVNHIKNVLRMREGEEAAFVSGDNLRYLAVFSGIEEDTAVFKVRSMAPAASELPTRITLFQGIPKGDKLEFITEKAVELGAFRIVPVAMRRSVKKIESKKEEAYIRRLNAISKSAAEQSKRALVPEVTRPMRLPECLQLAKDENMQLLLPYELENGMEKTRALLTSLEKDRPLGIFIGPEGGFDPQEVEELLAGGARPMTLGKRILRTETAGIMLLSVLSYLLEEDA